MNEENKIIISNDCWFEKTIGFPICLTYKEYQEDRWYNTNETEVDIDTTLAINIARWLLNNTETPQEA